jgi:hypothetical protein
MKRLHLIHALLAGLLLAAAAPVWAQQPPAPAAGQAWSSLSGQQQELLGRYQ